MALDVIERAKKNITRDKIADLKSLTEHDGWKVFIELCELHKIELWQSVIDVDFNDEKQLKTLSDRQIYVNAFDNVLKIPWKMEQLETFTEYDESEIMPNYDSE